jgi:hypothetical protein
MPPQDPDWIYHFNILSVPAMERKNKGSKRYHVYKNATEFEEVEASTAQEALRKSGIETPNKLLITNLRIDDIMKQGDLIAGQVHEGEFLMPQSLMDIVLKHRKIAAEKKAHDPYFRHTHASEPEESTETEKPLATDDSTEPEQAKTPDQSESSPPAAEA